MSHHGCKMTVKLSQYLCHVTDNTSILCKDYYLGIYASSTGSSIKVQQYTEQANEEHTLNYVREKICAHNSLQK